MSRTLFRNKFIVSTSGRISKPMSKTEAFDYAKVMLISNQVDEVIITKYMEQYMYV